MTGIIGALSEETEKIIGMMTDVEKETVGRIEFTKGKISKSDVVVAVCGVGKVFAAMCTEAMILRYAPDEIINTGVGGALDKTLKILDTVIAESVCQHDMDTSALDGERGMIPEIDITYIKCDENIQKRLFRAAQNIDIAVRSGIVASGDQFIASDAKKDDIIETFGASVCEMEGAAIGQVCYVNSVPFCVLRAISDGANDDSPVDYPAFCAKASDNNAEIIKAYLSDILN